MRRTGAVLWAALAINAVMFVIEVSAGLGAASLSLQADSLDFLGDAANYGVALFVLGLPLRWRATTALLKAAAMALFGLWIFAQAADQALHPGLPSAAVMSGIGMLALAANLACALLLYRHRFGDSNRRAVWLCTRNDAFGNIAVIAAAGGVICERGAVARCRGRVSALFARVRERTRGHTPGRGRTQARGNAHAGLNARARPEHASLGGVK